MVLPFKWNLDDKPFASRGTSNNFEALLFFVCLFVCLFFCISCDQSVFRYVPVVASRPPHHRGLFWDLTKLRRRKPRSQANLVTRLGRREQRPHQKVNTFSLAKQQLCTCITLFCTLSLPSQHNYDVKWTNFKFTWGRERPGDKFYHLCLNSGAVHSLQH